MDVIQALLTLDKPSEYFEKYKNTGTFPQLDALIGIEQEPRFHPEGDVWNHTMQVVDKAAQLRDKAENPLGFMLSALCHDLGKVTATAVIDGRIRALGHEEQGIAPAKKLLGIIGVDTQTVDYVINMTLLHMRPNMLVSQKSGDKAYKRLFDKSVCPNDLILIAEADHASRPGFEDYTEARIVLNEKLKIYNEKARD
ncbi:MAG: HD domain-containing protein [Clostridia bacterium]|nr:HD domain-containing protein [Clostridia bacterium]